MKQRAPARRLRQYGSSNGSKSPSICFAIASKTRWFLAALVVVVVQVEPFAPRATWSPRSISTGPLGHDPAGSRGRGRGRTKVFDAVVPSGRSSGESVAWSSRAASRLWIAREDQQQQQRRQHQDHDGHPPTIADSSSRWAGNDTSTTPVCSSGSGSGSSDSSASMNDPAVLPVVGDIRRVNMDALRVRKRVEQEEEHPGGGSFVDLFRACAPYIRAHLGAVMVIHMGGEVLEYPNFLNIMDDLGLLRLLGVSERSLGAWTAPLSRRFARTLSTKYPVLAVSRPRTLTQRGYVSVALW